jgi:hypothetical protein
MDATRTRRAPSAATGDTPCGCPYCGGTVAHPSSDPRAPRWFVPCSQDGCAMAATRVVLSAAGHATARCRVHDPAGGPLF